ncbi:MAG: hypothetical protein EPO61_01900 [Nitrospirae bacterium]|nr:MAG: hypothetical protein EPO61_01900 [Nitrospirota bacterium]
MKCKHRFKIYGRVRPQALLPIQSRFYLWEFEAHDGLLTHLTATVNIPNRDDWPMTTMSPKPGVAALVNLKAPHLPFIQFELYTIQGLLSLFGVRSIDVQKPELEWIAENEEERAALHIHSFKSGYTEPDPRSMPLLPFDLLARSVLAAEKAHEIEIPLNFFRRSLVDIFEKQYIEAIYDLYFVLETAFGNGQTKKGAILNEFKTSPGLREAVDRALRDPGPAVVHEQRVRHDYELKYRCKSPDDYLRHIVELRGFLHHHTQRRKGIWHPERQEKYETEALVLQAVAFNVIFPLALKYLDDQEVVALYHQNIDRFQSGPS